MHQAKILDRNGEKIHRGDVVVVGTVKCEVFEATLNEWTFLIACSITKNPKVYRLGLVSRRYIIKCV